MTNPYLLRQEAARIIGEDRVPLDVVEQLVEQFGQEEPILALNVACDGVFIGDEYYDVEQMSEVLSAVELAVSKKKETPDAVVTLVLGRVSP